MAAFQEANLEDDYEAGRLSTAQFLERLRQIGQLRCVDEELVLAWSDIFW